MRVLVCGDRDWDDKVIIFIVLDGILRTSSGSSGGLIVIHGGAKGADTLADDWAKSRGVHRESYHANWERFGKAAGPVRNQLMIDEGKPELVVAFHDFLPNSKGTRDMVSRARKAGIRTYVIGRAK